MILSLFRPILSNTLIVFLCANFNFYNHFYQFCLIQIVFNTICLGWSCHNQCIEHQLNISGSNDLNLNQSVIVLLTDRINHIVVNKYLIYLQRLKKEIILNIKKLTNHYCVSILFLPTVTLKENYVG